MKNRLQKSDVWADQSYAQEFKDFFNNVKRAGNLNLPNK